MSALRIRLPVREEQDAALMSLAGWSAVAHVAAGIVFLLAPELIPKKPPPPLVLTGQIVTMPASGGGAPTPPAPRTEPRKPAAEPARPPAAPKPPAKPAPPRPRKSEIIPPEPGKKPERKEPPRKQDEQGGPAGSEKSPAAAPHQPAGPIEQGVGLGAGGGESTGIPSITSEVFPFDWYRTTIVNLIRSRWRRPVTPGLTQALRCAVSFVVSRAGAVSDVAVSSASGFSALDESAFRAVSDSNPLPALPYQYTSDSVRAELIFELTPD